MRTTTSDTGLPNELFFPPLKLKKSSSSKTKQALYSVSTSKTFGPGTRLELYIEPSALPSPPPTTLELMIYRSHPATARRGANVYRLTIYSEHPGNAVRYDMPGYGTKALHSVYLPEKMVGTDAPPEVFLEVRRHEDEEKVQHFAGHAEDPGGMIIARGAKYWFSLARWAKTKNVFEGWERRLMFRLGKYIRAGWGISDKMAKQGFRLMQEADSLKDQLRG
jgi:hypothetical protein